MGFLLAIEGAASQGVLWGIMTLGVFITFRILNFPDLTVDGSFALGGAVSAVLLTASVDPIISLCIAFVIGTLSGVITALLHTKLKIPGILAGILTMIGLYSINIRIMGKANIPLLGVTTLMNNAQSFFGFDKTMSSLFIGIVASLIIIALLYLFFGTEIGSALRATGDNEKMARAQGINTDSMKLAGLALSNGLVALSGGLVAQSQGYADVGMGTGTIVIGLASIIIGEVLFGKRFAFWYILLSLIFGSIIYRIIIAVVLQLGLKSTDLKLLTAAIVAFALAIPVIQANFAQILKSSSAKKNNGGKNA
ncbi:MAG: ABC transporter permease [Spirochaetales bacterium]